MHQPGVFYGGGFAEESKPWICIYTQKTGKYAIVMNPFIRGIDAFDCDTIIAIEIGGGEMRWQEVQERFPAEWVVLEATKAHSDGGHRYIEEVVVIDTFADSTEALRRYSELHRQEPDREYCFFHTSRPELIARERYVGVRGPR